MIKPDAGEIHVHGRVAALIELGTGFDPVLTGRENIAVNAAIVGLPVARLREVTDEVVAFAELQDTIDAPVRTYSSGMVARLAFAVAAHVEPDVLLIDEVFAVGDNVAGARTVYVRGNHGRDAQPVSGRPGRAGDGTRGHCRRVGSRRPAAGGHRPRDRLVDVG